MMSGISMSSWDRILPTQFAALPPILFRFDCLASYVWLGMAANNPNVYMSMTAEQMGAADADMCGQLIPPAFKNIPLAAWANTTTECISGVVDNSIRELTPAIFRTIGHSARDYLMAYWGLPGQVLVNMTDAELKHLGPIALTSIDATSWVELFNFHASRIYDLVYSIRNQMAVFPFFGFQHLSRSLSPLHQTASFLFLKISRHVDAERF